MDFLKSNPHLASGFILQKDVYTTNLLYANDQFPIKKLSTILPFRPPTGRVPQDPSNCVTIIRQNGYISYNIENENIFYAKNTFKPKKLKHRKLKFPIPKYKLPPLSASDFYSSLRDKNIRIKYIDDDLNITSKNGKKILYTFKDQYYSNYDNKPRFINKNNIIKKKDNKSQSYSEYFDFGFHSRINELFNNKPQTIKNDKKTLTNRVNSFRKKIFPKEITFKTQIDFNKLYRKRKFLNRAKTANVRSNVKSPINVYKKN